jgi:hypothetical protein
MTINNILRTAAYWLLPEGIAQFVKYPWRHIRDNVKLTTMPFLKHNRKFKDCHKGERCFILGCGPTINKQDLTLLKGELCIAVSNFFLHKDYHLIHPLYHCIPDIVVGHSEQNIEEEYAVRWFREMEGKTGDATIFLSCYGIDKQIIEQYGLLRNRKIYYIYFGDNWDEVERKGIDLTKVTPIKLSVAIMALEIAVYMGCQNIYLLGCEHDLILHFQEGRRHFYLEHENILTKRPGYVSWKEHGWHRIFRDSAKLWQQYTIIDGYAKSKGIHIYNATAGGILDVYPRVQYESLF